MSGPNKYRRLAPPPQTLDDYSQQTLFSQEKFKTWNFIGNGVYAVDTGIIHRFQLAATCSRHLIWIAPGAHLHGSNIDFWFLQGALFFYRAGRPVGSLIFGDADQLSANTAAQIAAAVRLITRTAPDANGSFQPSMRYQESNAAAIRNNLDMACLEIPIVADACDYTVQASRIEITSGSEIRILTGCRIISTP